jgi:hypothetical protein
MTYLDGRVRPRPQEYARRGSSPQQFGGNFPALFLSAMIHADAILGVAGLAGMILQAGLLNLAAQFAVVRLRSLRCGYGAT